MESIYLNGSEDVRRAGSAMQDAAENMKRAAGEMQHAVFQLGQVLEQQRQFMDDWLERFNGKLRKDEL